MHMRTVKTRIGLSLSLTVLMMGAGLPAARAAAPKRVGVVKFSGPAEGASRNVVMKVVKAAHYQVIGGQQIEATAKKLHVRLDDNDSFKAVAKSLGISAFVTGEVTKKKATLTVRSGDDGTVAGESSWAGANPRKLSLAVHKTFWKKLGSAIEHAKAPSGAKADVAAAEETAPETGADEEEAEKGGKAPSPTAAPAAAESESSTETTVAKKAPRTSGARTKEEQEKKEGGEEEAASGTADALDVSGGLRTLSRSLTYTDNRSDLSKYSLPVAPQIGANADFYPGALVTTGFLTNVGLTGDIAYLLPVVKTAAPPGSPGSYSTYSLSWSLGVKVRLPYGLYGTVGYGTHKFQLVRQTQDTPPPVVPMVDYHFVRIGAGIRYPATPTLALMASAGYLRCLGSLGDFSDSAYFPKATAAAFEAGVGVGYKITPKIEARVGADVQRFGLATNLTVANQTPGNPIAGGAVDQYLEAWLAVAYTMGGSEAEGGGGGKSAKESTNKPAKGAAKEPASDETEDGSGDKSDKSSKGDADE